MNSKSRIASILNAKSLGSSVTGFPTFELSDLHIQKELDFILPTNIRLGHLAEKIVSRLIQSSLNYTLVYENVQILEHQKTIGEIDFIIEDIKKKQILHLELAYKFYLFDPNISSEGIHNWIGPNRNDSLIEKLDKLNTKQFPLLYHPCTALQLENIDVKTISQALCLLVSLFVPYDFKTKLDSDYQKAIKGYYFNFETFNNLDTSDKLYFLPPKTAWGIDPSENKIWSDYNNIKEQLKKSIHEKQAPLCWQQHQGTYMEFFIVWW
ncbi:DUF1853 family protein [Flavobacterium cellulosilyticum]|uniref:DUF1853 family protein n=1 Tax=Flavobacterium cellulosilyticum TaxID=2541731 RepID=A0A4R5CBX2_9FLAO|nr:DUF1853 family protein [Flavobacterium cellulosilyticum]TDD97461.1 DUF1853 family protein [Flavobacterium cellulosilyticum]